MCCLSPLCCLLQVFKSEIRESGWVRLTDVLSGEPVWLQQQQQLSLLFLSAQLLLYSDYCLFPPLFSFYLTFFSSLHSPFCLCPLFTHFAHFCVKSLPLFLLFLVCCSHFDTFPFFDVDGLPLFSSFRKLWIGSFPAVCAPDVVAHKLTEPRVNGKRCQLRLQHTDELPRSKQANLEETEHFNLHCSSYCMVQNMSEENTSSNPSFLHEKLKWNIRQNSSPCCYRKLMLGFISGHSCCSF